MKNEAVRDIAQGSVIRHLLIEYLKEKGEATGYDMLKCFRQNEMTVSPGSVYPLLRAMLNEGLLTVYNDGRRRVYRLSGHDRLQQESKVMADELGKKKRSTIQMLVYCNCRDLDERSRKAIQNLIQLLSSTHWESEQQVAQVIQSVRQMDQSLVNYLNTLKHKRKGEVKE